ncbi:hypothetical protein BCF89_10725 [Metamycoplasma auris]|uniref:AAA domain-containing protein n=1 Tax=Metamycoplasma auris TaxID=51363 RepID=A0A2W7GPL7_9BACT|nr:hypothetical protein BCF89_10725 [Metamycoplasma auris]
MNIQRNKYLEQLISKIYNGRVKVIAGIRRCGKSYLLLNLFKNYLLENGVEERQIISLNLNNIANAKYHNPLKLYNYILSKTANKDIKYYVFID